QGAAAGRRASRDRRWLARNADRGAQRGPPRRGALPDPERPAARPRLAYRATCRRGDAESRRAARPAAGRAPARPRADRLRLLRRGAEDHRRGDHRAAPDDRRGGRRGAVGGHQLRLVPPGDPAPDRRTQGSSPWLIPTSSLPALYGWSAPAPAIPTC